MARWERYYVQIHALCTLGEVSSKEVKEGLHFGIKGLGRRIRWTRCERGTTTYPLGCGILDGVDETTDLVAHGLGSDTSGGGLEVDVTAAADTGVEGVGAWCEGRHCSGRG